MSKAGMDRAKFVTFLERIQQDAIKAGECMVKNIPREASVWDAVCLAGGYIASFLVTVFPTGVSSREKCEARFIYRDILLKVAESLDKTLAAR